MSKVSILMYCFSAIQVASIFVFPSLLRKERDKNIGLIQHIEMLHGVMEDLRKNQKTELKVLKTEVK